LGQGLVSVTFQDLIF